MTLRRSFTFINLLVLIFIVVRYLPGCGEGLDILTNGSGGTGTENWEDWSYRRSVTISNSGAALTDYQVNVIVNTDNDFYMKADADGDDIRFNYNGTSLSYWIENWNPAGVSSIWVKVPSLPSDETLAIYLYYGNADQPAASNFDNTFTKNSGFTGLVAHWHMDEESGAVIYDSSGNSNTGTISGAAWAGADGGGWYNRSDAGFSAGDSLVFDGTDDYVAVADHNSLDVGSITIVAWVKRIGNDAGHQYVVSKWDISGQRSYAISINSGIIYFWTNDNGLEENNDSINLSNLIDENKWYHVAVTSDGNNKKIYLNGEEESSGLWLKTIHAGTAALVIGSRDSSPSASFDGAVDEISIYNDALSVDEIRALSQRRKYSSGVGVPTLGAEEIVP